MDQKNTIVKCNRSPKCLFEHNGVCDNYVINIGADGKCACYVETARVDNFDISEIEEIAIYKPDSKEPLLILKEPKRGQRAQCNVYDDACDYEQPLIYYTDKTPIKIKQPNAKIKTIMPAADACDDKVAVKMKIAELNKPNKNKSVIRPMSDHLCDIRCVSAHYAEDGELYCSLIQDYPERPLRCPAYDDGGEE